MGTKNFERMIQLAEEAFDVRNDPEQLDVNEKTIKKLHKLHPSTLAEYKDDNGPAVWILLIPTTTEVMEQFLENKINEQQLLDNTPVNADYTSIYLCSAMTLPEYRRKGIAKRLTIEAINAIRKDHPIKNLFVWPFSKEGDILAEHIAQTAGLPLLKKEPHITR
jgi:ribosomal protein S18 acetylase RimI-like enzyme